MKIKNWLLYFCIELISSFVAINLIFAILGTKLENINKTLQSFIICLFMVLLMKIFIPFLTEILKLKK